MTRGFRKNHFTWPGLEPRIIPGLPTTESRLQWRSYQTAPSCKHLKTSLPHCFGIYCAIYWLNSWQTDIPKTYCCQCFSWLNTPGGAFLEGSWLCSQEPFPHPHRTHIMQLYFDYFSLLLHAEREAMQEWDGDGVGVWRGSGKWERIDF